MSTPFKQFLRRLRRYLMQNLTTASPKGSGLGVYLRTITKRLNAHQIIGVHLAGFAFFSGIVIPQTKDLLSSLELRQENKEIVIVVDTSGSTWQWPLKRFGISTFFSAFHPGMDLTDPLGTPIYPIGDGKVEWVEFLPYGYGHHVLVAHDDGLKSLYAHLASVFVKPGETVTKTTPIGEIGLTGRTTGSHLHLEVYQDQTPSNPLEVLPQLKDSASPILTSQEILPMK